VQILEELQSGTVAATD